MGVGKVQGTGLEGNKLSPPDLPRLAVRGGRGLLPVPVPSHRASTGWALARGLQSSPEKVQSTHSPHHG